MEASFEIEVYGVAGKEEEVADALSEVTSVTPDEVTDGFVARGSNSYFIEDTVSGLLQDLGIGFVIRQCGTYEWTGEWIAFTPELGRYRSNWDDDGGTHLIAAEQIEKLAKAAGSLTKDQLVTKLDELSGGPWRRHFTDLKRLTMAAAA